MAIEQLAITAREEIPGTMGAVHLLGMDISDHKHSTMPTTTVLYTALPYGVCQYL